MNFFRMLEMIRFRTSVEAEADFFKLDNVCLSVFFMMRKKSLTKVIKRQYNRK